MITVFYQMAFILNILLIKRKVIILCRCLRVLTTCRPCWLGLPFSFRSHLYYNIYYTTLNTDIKVIWLLVKIAVGIHLYTGRGEDYCKVEAPSRSSSSAGVQGTVQLYDTKSTRTFNRGTLQRNVLFCSVLCNGWW